MHVQTAEADTLHLPGKGVPAIHVASLCVQNSYCSCCVARTLMFNAKKDQLEAYRCMFVCVCVFCVCGYLCVGVCVFAGGGVLTYSDIR
jgi:hypothetical protein